MSLVEFNTTFNDPVDLRRFLRSRMPEIASFSVRSQLAILAPAATSRLEDIQLIFLVYVSEKDVSVVRELLKDSNVFVKALKEK